MVTMRHRLPIFGYWVQVPCIVLSLELKGNFNELEGVAIMRMTNIEIVSMAWAELVSNGTISESEKIHTFAKWRELGYSVKRGEKCIVKLTIWKHTSRTNKETQEEESRMFMKTAAFFSTSQVEKIQPVKRADPSEFVGRKVTINIGK